MSSSAVGVDSAPDSIYLADAAAAWRSAYVHIPFCRRRCPYCDFAVVTPEEGGTRPMIGRYVDALLAEIGREPSWGKLDAVNFGGGTPSSMGAADIVGVLGALESRFGIAEDAEVSLEANPEDVTDATTAALVNGGVTRLTLGVQSLQPGVLASLGRVHSPEQAKTAFGTARRSGVSSIGMDLIFGTPGESLDSWRDTAQRALELEPDHVSAYALTVEPGTALWREVGAGARGPDEDHQADEYELFASLAMEAGLVRYEVSNWARPGHVCRYNLSTWAQGEYLAFGLGAHGHRDGVRTRNVRRLSTYLDRIEGGEAATFASEPIMGWAAEQERLMLGLRRAAGVAAGSGGAALIGSRDGSRMVEAGVMTVDGDRIVVKRPLLTDEVVRSVLAMDEPRSIGSSGPELSLSP